jgi:hypothetical protein
MYGIDFHAGLARRTPDTGLPSNPSAKRGCLGEDFACGGPAHRDRASAGPVGIRGDVLTAKKWKVPCARLHDIRSVIGARRFDPSTTSGSRRIRTAAVQR